MAFEDNVETDCDWGDLDKQVRKKVNEIAQDGGRGDHGRVTLSDGTKCLHWRAGDYRIFGTYKSGTFHFIGWGSHTGRGDSKYKVELCSGKRVRAETS